MLISECLQEYLIEHEIRGNSKHTIRYYDKNITAFMAFTGDILISSVNVNHLKSYYLYLKTKPVTSVTIQTYIRAVRAFLTWCYHEEYISFNLSDKFKLPKAARKVIDVLTNDEIHILLSSFNTKTFIGLRNICICLLMLDSGLRLNEVVCLNVGSLHLSEGYIVVRGKGNKERFVPVGLNTKKYLLRYVHSFRNSDIKTALFVKDTLCRIEITTIRQLFRRLKVKTGISRLRPHLLRHTFATRYLENGGDVYSLQSILGHTTLEMTKRYVQTTPFKLAVTFSNYSPVDNIKKTLMS